MRKQTGFSLRFCKDTLIMKNNFDNDNNVHLVLDQNNYLDLYSASSLLDRHVAPLGHIILIPSQPVFSLIL
jgi:hypothetical protein